MIRTIDWTVSMFETSTLTFSYDKNSNHDWKMIKYDSPLIEMTIASAIFGLCSCFFLESTSLWLGLLIRRFHCLTQALWCLVTTKIVTMIEKWTNMTHLWLKWRLLLLFLVFGVASFWIQLVYDQDYWLDGTNFCLMNLLLVVFFLTISITIG